MIEIAGPSARFGFVSGLSDGDFYVATGVGLSEKAVNDVWKFSMT